MNAREASQLLEVALKGREAALDAWTGCVGGALNVSYCAFNAGLSLDIQGLFCLDALNAGNWCIECMALCVV